MYHHLIPFKDGFVAVLPDTDQSVLDIAMIWCFSDVTELVPTRYSLLDSGT